MTDSIGDRLRSLLASDVYNEKGRLRPDRVPPFTREQPFRRPRLWSRSAGPDA